MTLNLFRKHGRSGERCGGPAEGSVPSSRSSRPASATHRRARLRSIVVVLGASTVLLAGCTTSGTGAPPTPPQSSPTVGSAPSTMSPESESPTSSATPVAESTPVLLTGSQMRAALLTVDDISGRGWKRDRSPAVTENDQWRPKRCGARLDAFGRDYLIKGNSDARVQVSFDRGKDFTQQSIGEVIIRRDEPVVIADVAAEIAELVDACPQLTPVPDTSPNSIDLPVVLQFSVRETPQFGDGSTGMRMQLNATIVTFYIDVVFTAVDNYLIAISSTSLNPRPKALADASTVAVDKLLSALDAAAGSPPQTVPTPSPSATAAAG